MSQSQSKSAGVAALGSVARVDNPSPTNRYGRADIDKSNGIVEPNNSAVQQSKSRLRGSISLEKVLQSFNTRAFKREQPSDPDLMREIISESMSAGAPVPFILYWGKGPRSGLDRPDIECLE